MELDKLYSKRPPYTDEFWEGRDFGRSVSITPYDYTSGDEGPVQSKCNSMHEDLIVYNDPYEKAPILGKILSRDPEGKYLLIHLFDRNFFRIKLRLVEKFVEEKINEYKFYTESNTQREVEMHDGETFLVKESNLNDKLFSFMCRWDEGEAAYIDTVWTNYVVSEKRAMILIWGDIVHDELECSTVDIGAD